MKRLLRFSITLALLIGIFLPNSASVEAANTAIVSVDSVLNVREKASAQSKKVGTLKKGTKVTVYSKTKSGWSEIRINKKKAYVSTKYLKFSAAVAKKNDIMFAKTTFQTTANLNLRSGAGAKDSLILTIPKGKKVTSTQKKGNTYKVSYIYKSKGKNVKKTGWVSGNYLKEYYAYTTTSGTYYLTTKATNLHSTADTKKKAVSKVAQGNVLYSTQKAVNSLGQTWYRVTLNGKNLYVNSGNVKKDTLKTFSETKYKAKKDTDLYSSYGNVYPSLVKIPKGTIISSKQRVSHWYKGSFNGKSGYINIGDFTKYTAPIVKKEERPKEQPPKEEQPKVNPPKVEPPKEEPPKVDPPKVEPPKEEPPKVNSPKVEPSKEEPPKVDPPKVEPPKEEPPKVNSPKVEPPKEDAPKVEPPKVEAPKEDPPKETITEEKIPEKTFLINDSLNVRRAADPASAKLTTIPKGIIVIPTHKTSNNWYKVAYNGKTGYISGAYVQEVKTGDPMNNRTGYQFIDLRTQSPVTATQINNYIANYVGVTKKTSVLSGKGQVFIDSGKKYGVNGLYLAAHAIHESAHGTSHLAVGKLNFFGFGAFDATPYVGAYRFSDINESIDYIAREMKATYLNPSNWKYSGAYLGFSTKTLSNTRIDANSEGMNFWYASDPNWGQKIASHMEKILPYNKAYYDKAAVDKEFPTRPNIPSGSDVFPNDILAVANRDFNLQSKKGMNDHVKVVKKGTTFTLLEKINDYWVKVKVDSKEYWTNDIKFDVYKNYLSVQNLGRVNVDSLNVRTGPGTSYSITSTLGLNEYVHIILKKDGTLTMDSSKTWYQVKLSNGSTGWVSSQYITRELK
ncbi:SH3 domain-containing protein [Lederbergia citrea]|uniref:SH3 domain-containing protein n=1 Tax=Lederbergia citrea TaxID=2833581 RepID=UPI001BC9AADA|nr:SH3 domain-containing protein [Lederbergia citrea]MBS4178098.1 SH3 domain-containing protein [Lederbergia citrea]